MSKFNTSKTSLLWLRNIKVSVRRKAITRVGSICLWGKLAWDSCFSLSSFLRELKPNTQTHTHTHTMHWRNSDFKIYQVKKVVCENASSLHPEGSANRLHSNPTRLRNQQPHVGPGEGDALPPLAPPPPAGAWSSGTLVPGLRVRSLRKPGGLDASVPTPPWPRPHALRGARIAVVFSLYSSQDVCTRRQTRERTRTIFPEARLSAPLPVGAGLGP